MSCTEYCLQLPRECVSVTLLREQGKYARNVFYFLKGSKYAEQINVCFLLSKLLL